MLTLFRKLSKSPVAAVLIGLLVISFAVFGLNDVFNARGGSAVIEAGEREVDAADFKRVFDQQLERVRAQGAPNATAEEAVKQGLHVRLAEEMAGQEALAEYTRKAGVRPSDVLVVEQIRKIPRFFNQISGLFDQQAYAQALQEVNLTEEKFELSVRDEIANQHVGTGIAAGFRAPRIYGALQAAFALETRDASWFEITPASLGPTPAPTDAQLQAFLKENEAQLRRPEFRQFTVALFTAQDLAGSVVVDEAELRKRFEFKKDSLSQPELRTFVQIPARNPDAARRIAASLNAGQDPAAVARANGADVVSFNDRPRTAVPDRAVAQAAFSLAAGQTSEPVRGELGLSVVKVLTVSPARQATFESARAQLEQEYRREAATERVYDAVQKYEQARDDGASLVDAARVAGVRTITLPPVTAQGQAPNGQRLGAPESLFKTGFSLQQNGESDVEEAGNGEFFAVRVDRVVPSALPTLEQVRAPLQQQWVLRETARRMQERAETLAERLRKGEALPAVAAASGAAPRKADDVRRQDVQTYGQDFVGKLFAVRPGDAFTARGQQFSFLVAKADAVASPAASAPVARLTEEARPQISIGLLNELGVSVRAAAREAVEAVVRPEAAAAAVGVAPQEDAAPEGKAKK